MRALCLRVARLAAAVVLSTVPARAEMPVGTWLAFHDVSGSVVGHIEELRIEGSGAARIAIHRPNFDEACNGAARLEKPECTAPLVHLSGRMDLDVKARRLTFLASGPPAKTLADVDGERGPALWLTPGVAMPFVVAGSGRLLRLRPTIIGTPAPGIHPKLPTLPARLYVRADAGMPDDLLLYADFWGRPIALLACVVPVLAEDDTAWPPFRALVGDVARIERHLLRLEKALKEAGGQGDRQLQILAERDDIKSLNPAGSTFQAEVKARAPKLGVRASSLEAYVRYLAASRAAALVLPPLPPEATPIAADVESCVNALTK